MKMKTQSDWTRDNGVRDHTKSHKIKMSRSTSFRWLLICFSFKIHFVLLAFPISFCLSLFLSLYLKLNLNLVHLFCLFTSEFRHFNLKSKYKHKKTNKHWITQNHFITLTLLSIFSLFLLVLMYYLNYVCAHFHFTLLKKKTTPTHTLNVKRTISINTTRTHMKPTVYFAIKFWKYDNDNVM